MVDYKKKYLKYKMKYHSIPNHVSLADPCSNYNVDQYRFGVCWFVSTFVFCYKVPQLYFKLNSTLRNYLDSLIPIYGLSESEGEPLLSNKCLNIPVNIQYIYRSFYQNNFFDNMDFDTGHNAFSMYLSILIDSNIEFYTVNLIYDLSEQNREYYLMSNFYDMYHNRIEYNKITNNDYLNNFNFDNYTQQILNINIVFPDYIVENSIKSGYEYIWNTIVDIKNIFTNLNQNKPYFYDLCGGFIGTELHINLFTICDGRIIICNYGDCTDNDDDKYIPESRLIKRLIEEKKRLQDLRLVFIRNNNDNQTQFL